MKTKCQICGRQLKALDSINNGIGPECAAKYAAGIESAGSSFAAVEALEALDNASVNRWLGFAKQAIGRGRINEAQGFIEAAEKAAPLPAVAPIATPALPLGEDCPLILIAPAAHGGYEVKLPFRHYAFLAEFKLKIGRSFRTWNEFRECWQIKPIDAGHLELVAQIIRSHFKNYEVAISE